MKKTPLPKSKKLSRAPLPRVVLHWHEEKRRGVSVDHARTVEHPDGGKTTLDWPGDYGTLKERLARALDLPQGTYKFVCSQIHVVDGVEVTSRVFLREGVVSDPAPPK